MLEMRQRIFRLSPLLISILTFSLALPAANSGHPLLFRNPAVSQAQIVFEYANDLWIVSREGGEARRLTSGIGREFNPHFSPDGTQIAFSGEYDGNIDVFVIPASGGVPRRLTYHPGPDIAVGWTPDGKRILFNSRRDAYADSGRLYTIGLNGGLPEALPLPTAEDGSYSSDGSHIAYVPVFQWQPAWKRYRGGQTTKIWLADLSDSSIVKVPRENSNDFNPMWSGGKVYFLSDRNGSVSLWAYDIHTAKVSEAVKNDGLDFKSASAGPGAIVYEQFGSIYLFDLKSGKTRHVDIGVSADLPEVRPHFEKLKVTNIENAALSPTGQRALFESHGEILTVPAEKGSIRNLTNTPSVADRDPAWSPDGKWIAYFSDESGEYALHIRDQNGLGEVKKISLGNPPSFFYSPVWSPDSKKIAYSDKRLNLWYLDLEKKTPVRIDTDLYDSPGYVKTAAWSPDSRWIVYAKQLHNHLHAIDVFSVADGKCTQVTDGMSDAVSPVFDKSGKYLYFLASTNVGLSSGWIDMSSIDHPVTSSVYVMVLRKDLASPLAPESDEENKPEADKAEKKDAQNPDQKADKDKDKAPPEVRIDFDNISQRILAVPVPDKNYSSVVAGKEGVIYLQEEPIVEMNPGPPQIIITKYDFKKRKADTVLQGATVFKLSYNGEKMLFRQGEQWIIAGAGQAPKAGEGALKLADMEVYVDPRAEWRQMYREVWRIERDFFYDPGLHGLDLKSAEQFYRPWMDGISTRSDLNYLFEEMLGNITVGHMFIRGGRQPDVPKLKVGLLGADYKLANGRYQFAKVFNGENWNPRLQAPLTQPGVNVKAGEYLLAVNGREVHATDSVYSFFQETAGKDVVLKVGSNPDGTGSREVTVIPIENETGLRHLDWVENNRRTVDRLSGGKLAYVHLPDTAMGGYTSFNRYFFAQVGREGAVIDERYNHGGDLADYIVEYLNRRPMSRIMSREGEDVMDPQEAIYGPKVMIINQFAGSGGDALPWYFRKAGIGPLIGERTWGGLIGIGFYPPLIDGGMVTAPRWAIYGLTGQWEVENHGIAPDVEVDLDPKVVRQGHDPQLERAVAVAMEILKTHPPATYKKPAYPNYHQHFTGTETQQ
ncbi:MAG TPA: PDZ domain-containing protein [Bryobacteraceae bacterium]|jgi:tricorn protease|nr:PDZ domain-containing protein [Bryobacteraceae bacterium]